jgi:hypothetical protein
LPKARPFRAFGKAKLRLEKTAWIFIFLKIHVLHSKPQRENHAMNTTVKLQFKTEHPKFTLTLFVRGVVHTIMQGGKTPRLFDSIESAEQYASRFEQSPALAGVRLYSVIEECAS